MKCVSFFIAIIGIRLARSKINEIKKTNITESIINGIMVGEGVFPWYAAVYVVYHNNYYNVCGGSLIDNSWVLTASHCLHPGGSYVVDIGRTSNFANAGVIRRRVDYVCGHKYFNTQKLSNDIALFHLEQPVHGVEKVSLGTYASQPFYEDMQFKVMGMGVIHPTNEIYSDYLLEANVQYVNGATCKRKWNPFYDNTKFCATGKGAQDSCIGDSGGPLVRMEGNKWVQEGIVSFGPRPCNLKGVPVLYTKLRAMKQWIQSVTLNSDFSQCN